MTNTPAAKRQTPRVRPLVIVSIRYSVLLKESSQWNIARGKSEDSYRAALFDDQRLALHFYLFSTVTLPSLQAQVPEPDPDYFRVYIIVSTDLPRERKDELAKLVENIAWIKIKEVSPNEARIPYSSQISEFFSDHIGSASVYAHVRLDDDDALSSDFVANIENYATGNNVGRVVSFGRGVMANFDVKERRFTGFREMHYPKVAMGLTLIGKRKNSSQTVFPNVYSLGNHTKIDLTTPTIIDSRRISYIRTMHSMSDTQAKNTSGALGELGIDVVRQHFPSI